MTKTAVIGGGAAGFFLAINLKEMCPQMDITILEASKRVLAKVEISGGGRCNGFLNSLTTAMPTNGLSIAVLNLPHRRIIASFHNRRTPTSSFTFF